jgi:Golgi nucleoside diphosphatase
VFCDAGSTGTRTYVYNVDSSRHEEDGGRVHVVEGQKVNPGFSALTDKSPDELAGYLYDSIMDAARVIPKSAWKDVHFYVYGTAGLRALPLPLQTKLFDNLHTGLLAAHIPFKVHRSFLPHFRPSVCPPFRPSFLYSVRPNFLPSFLQSFLPP